MKKILLLSIGLFLMLPNLSLAQKKSDSAAIDIMPKFNGDLNSFLVKNLHYPANAIKKNIEGKVILKFIVNEDGSISDVTVVKGIGGGCDEEAKRVVQLMPNWKPGSQNGKYVKVFFTLPVHFKLDEPDNSSVAKFKGRFKDYFTNNLKYPQEAQKNHVIGNVTVSFKVAKDGRISHVRVTDGIGSGCDEEAIRLIQNMPNWLPAKNKKGKPVKSNVELQIPFTGK